MRTKNTQTPDYQGNNFFNFCDMDVHIGREIERKFDESGIKPEEFAKRINTGKRNLYSIFKRQEISSGQLLKISRALNYDFFSLYQQHTKRLEHAEKRPATVSIVVELDGLPETVDAWCLKLKRINKAIL